MSIPTEKLIPHTISDTGTIDEDSGLRQFRGMITPWERIKSFRETCHFLWRHGAIMAVAYMNAFKCIEPDYETRQNIMSNNWAATNKFMMSPEDPIGMIKNFEERHDIPPFAKKSLYRSGCFADHGDEYTGMPGYLWYASTDRIEKQVHQCPLDIVGPDACDLSHGGGMYFMKGANGYNPEGHNDYLTQRKGCGDPYCHVLQETVAKCGPHTNADGYDWEMWGPGATPQAERDCMPPKLECEWMHTGEFIGALGARWTAGEMYKQALQGPLAYAGHAAGGIRTVTKPEDAAKNKYIVQTLFETAGKCQFAEYNTRKESREWLGVPADLNDGRVLGAYISMVMQARNMPWKFVEFSEKQVIVEVDTFMDTFFGQYPEFTDACCAYYDGIAKTLVDTQWVCQIGENAPEGKTHYVIKKAVYGFRRQKPGYDYADGKK